MRIVVDNYTTINEHRAPTDKSVQLLKEFEEKAEAKFREGIHLKSNNFETKVYRRSMPYDMADSLLALTKINGKTIETTFKADHAEIERSEDRKDVFLLKGLIDKLSKDIARELIIPAAIESKVFGYGY